MAKIKCVSSSLGGISMTDDVETSLRFRLETEAEWGLDMGEARGEDRGVAGVDRVACRVDLSLPKERIWSRWNRIWSSGSMDHKFQGRLDS